MLCRRRDAVLKCCTAQAATHDALLQTPEQIRKVSTVRLLKKLKIYFQNMLFLSDSPYLKLLFYIVPVIIKTFIITEHQFRYPLPGERGRLWRHSLLHAREQMKVTWRYVWAVRGRGRGKGRRIVPSQMTWWGLEFEQRWVAEHCHEATQVLE